MSDIELTPEVYKTIKNGVNTPLDSDFWCRLFRLKKQMELLIKHIESCQNCKKSLDKFTKI